MKDTAKHLYNACNTLHNTTKDLFFFDRLDILAELVEAKKCIETLLHLSQEFNLYYWAKPMFNKSLRNIDVIYDMFYQDVPPLQYHGKVNEDNIEQCKNTIAAWIEYYARYYENFRK